MTHTKLFALIGLVSLLVLAGVALGVAPSFDVVHDYEHGDELEDVTYDDEHDMVWSLDGEGGFHGYDVAASAVTVTEDFDTGHAIAVGDGVVYIAAADTLWEYDIDAGELSELGTLEAHPAAIAYDAERAYLWAGGEDDTVRAYNVSDVSIEVSYTAHSEGISSLDADGTHVATGTTWSDEAVVYDIEAGEVVFEPDLPGDVESVTAIHLTDDGQVVVGTGADFDEGDFVGMYDIDTEELLAEYREHVFSVADVTFDGEHEVIYSVGLDNHIQAYSVGDQAIVASHDHSDTLRTAALDSSNDLLWVGSGEEEPPAVTGYDVHIEVPTPTPIDTPDTPTPTPPLDDPTPTATPDDPTPTPSPAPEDDDDGIPGPGIIGTIFGVLAVGYGLQRWRRRE